MSKKQLEEIKHYYREMNSFDPGTQSDINWLIEQAERAQELEEEIRTHAPYGRNYTNAEYVELLQQNKRYREAYMVLEQIYKDNFVRNSYGYEDGFLDGIDTAINVIDEALEESK